MVYSLLQTTDGVARHERWDSWKDTVLCATDAESLGDRADFAAHRSVVSLSRGTVIDTTSAPLRIARTARHVARDGIDHACVLLLLRGRGHLDQAGRGLATVRPSDVVFNDVGRPFDMAGTARYRELRLYIPRALFGQRIARIESLAGLTVTADRPLATLFAGYLAGYAAALPTLPPDLAEAGLDGVLHLLSCLVGPVPAAGGDGGEALPGGSLLTLADRLIATRLGDADFDPVALARELGLSRTRLYAAFAGRGGVAVAIRDARLDRARHRLSSPADRHRSIQDVAAACGFTDMSNFGRAFRQRFGLSPRDCRPQ